MNINIETNTVQQVTSDQLDLLAKNLCGVRLTASDTSTPTIDADSISENGIIASSSDGVYGDTKDALEDLGVTVLSSIERLRILDPVVQSVLLNTFTHANDGFFTVLEFANINMNVDGLFNNVSNKADIVEFTELSKTNTTELVSFRFSDCSNLIKTDLSKITRITGISKFGGCDKIYDVGDISNLLIITGRVFSRDRYPMSNRYNNLVMPNLIGLNGELRNGNIYTDNSYGSPSLPTSVLYLYCPICLYCSTRSLAIKELKYAFFPSVTHMKEDNSNDYGTTFGNYTPDLKLLSVGPNLTVFCLNFWVYTNSTLPNASIVLHGNSVVDTTREVNFKNDSSLNKVGHLFLTLSLINSFASNYNFPSYSGIVSIIGSEDWKTQMQTYALDRSYSLPDQYTDFYYEYVDYLIGNVPLPQIHSGSPTEIKICTKSGELSDYDVICGIDDQVELIIYTDSYRNACTITLSDNNAGVTLNGRTLSIPSTANGETFVVNVVNNYDNTISKSLTLTAYGYTNKAISGVSVADQKLILLKLFKTKTYLTQSDLATLTSIPASAFKGTALSSADWLLYTNVEIIYDDAFESTLVTSVTYPTTIKQLRYRAFYNSKLASISIPSSVIRIGREVFNGTPAWSSVSQGMVYIDNWFFGYKQVNQNWQTYYTLNNFVLESYTIYTNYALTTTRTANNVPTYTIQSGTIGIAGGAFYNTNIHAIISSGVKYICDKSLNYYKGHLVLPDSVEYIFEAFLDAGDMMSITLGSGLKYIGDNSFYGCSYVANHGISSITIPATVEYIGKGAFARVWNLGVTILATTPPQIAINVDVFYLGSETENQNRPIYVPAASLDAYKTAWANVYQNVKNRLQAIPTT